MKKHILIILIVLSNFTLYPQNEMRIVGKGESLSGEQLIDKSVRDANGETCAGLIISSDLDGLSYDSYNGIVKTNSKPGEDFLFLSRDERVVTIYKSGYTSLKIILNDYGIKLNKGEVWKLKVTGDKKSNFLSVVIMTKPDGAEKIIDGERKGTGITFQLNEGNHQIKIEKSGFRTFEQNITVSTSKLVFNFSLEEITQQIVEIRSQPNEANIYIDGIMEGLTDNQIFRFPGKSQLRLSKSGFFDVNEEIIVGENQPNKFVYKLNKNSSTLTLKITPPAAEIEIDNKSYGLQRLIELAPGSHSLVVKQEGYQEKREIVNIEAGKPIDKTVELEPMMGNLLVKVTPIDATITLFQKDKMIESWNGAKNIKNLIIGDYTLQANLTGYEKVSKSIKLLEGKTTETSIVLAKNTDGNFNSFVSQTTCGSSISYEGKVYNIIQVGKQCWLKENLDVGTMIRGNRGSSNNSIIEKYCYDDDPNNCKTYGGLYQWEEAMKYSTTPGAQGICPTGWHIPTKAEFETLVTTVNNNGKALKAIGQGTGTNAYDFSALLSGDRHSNGHFFNSKVNAYIWSSTEFNVTEANYIFLSFYGSSVNLENNDKEYGYSVRCIHD